MSRSFLPLWTAPTYNYDRMRQYYICMKNTTKKKLITILPAAIAGVIIAVLLGLALLPALREDKTRTVSAELNGRDDEAMRVLNCCVAYCASHDFSATLSGNIKAGVLGVPYSLDVKGSRVVSGEDYTEAEECASAFIKVGLKKGRKDGEYFVATGEYKDKEFFYNDGRRMDKTKFINRYGLPHDGLTGYIIDGAVISATAVSQNEYKYVLDYHRATEYSKNEIKTLLKTDVDPVYESVELTIVTDGDRAVKITSREKFRVDKFGGTHCAAEYTEVFDYANI